MASQKTSWKKEDLRAVEKYGFRFDGVTHGTHVRLRHTGSGKVVFAALTPRAGCLDKNLVATLKRVDRQWRLGNNQL
jgi:predicted RNA binding protein YcfA (HicA-like mRNA interferase family)